MSEPKKNAQELREIYTEDYVSQYQHHDSYRLRRLMSRLHITRQHDVVDFACGNAMLLDLLAGKFKSYTGVDFSAEFIRSSEKKLARYPNQAIEFHCMDITQFGEKFPQRFDAGFAMDFSEHVYDEDWLAILQGMRLSLKPGAQLYLHTPNARFFLEIMKAKGWGLKQVEGHIAVRDMAANCKLLEQAGFSISERHYLPHYNILRYLHPFSHLPWLGTYLQARLFIVARA